MDDAGSRMAVSTICGHCRTTFSAKGTPATEIDRVNQAVRNTLNAEAVKAKLLASGAEPASSSPAELATLLKNDSAKWAKVVRSKNVKAD